MLPNPEPLTDVEIPMALGPPTVRLICEGDCNGGQHHVERLTKALELARLVEGPSLGTKHPELLLAHRGLAYARHEHAYASYWTCADCGHLRQWGNALTWGAQEFR